VRCPRWQTAAQKRLWQKHGLDALYDASNREHRKCLRIVKAIRKAKAQSMFGIGVKLSAWEDWDHIGEDEFVEVIHGVRRDIAALIGDDFIKATNRLAS
jgi:2,4-dienoyl-CoA reductase-like NADH-dependent reductase (Old Yellow Enzyme family)